MSKCTFLGCELAKIDSELDENFNPVNRIAKSVIRKEQAKNVKILQLSWKYSKTNSVKYKKCRSTSFCQFCFCWFAWKLWNLWRDLGGIEGLIQCSFVFWKYSAVFWEVKREKREEIREREKGEKLADDYRNLWSEVSKRVWFREMSDFWGQLVTGLNDISLHVSRPHHAGEIWTHSVISTVRPTVYTNPSGKQSFLKTLLSQSIGVWKCRLDDAMIITWLRCSSFPQKQNQWPVIVGFSNSLGKVTPFRLSVECLTPLTRNFYSCRQAGYSNLWAEFIQCQSYHRQVKWQKSGGLVHCTKTVNKYVNSSHEKPCFLVPFSVRLEDLFGKLIHSYYEFF